MRKISWYFITLVLVIPQKSIFPDEEKYYFFFEKDRLADSFFTWKTGAVCCCCGTPHEGWLGGVGGGMALRFEFWTPDGAARASASSFPLLFLLPFGLPLPRCPALPTLPVGEGSESKLGREWEAKNKFCACAVEGGWGEEYPESVLGAGEAAGWVRGEDSAGNELGEFNGLLLKLLWSVGGRITVKLFCKISPFDLGL